MFLLILFQVRFNSTWCDPPKWEFEPIPDASLLQIQILTRHGARTPLHAYQQNGTTWKCDNTELRYYSMPEQSPVKVHVAYGKSIFGGECHFGQLTFVGHEALKSLGKYIRSTYIEKLKFLPNRYDNHSYFIRSTGTHRTIHSAMAFAQGLYPDHHEIAVHVADKSLDTFRRASAVCPNLKKFIDEMKADPNVAARFPQNETAVKAAAKLFEIKNKVVPDIVMATRCNGRPLPDGIDVDAIDENAIAKARQQIYIFSSEKVYPLIFSFPFAEITNTFIQRATGNSTIKLKHWSGHNGNIFGLLAYLGEDIEVGPAYGSYILMELWKTRKGEHLVRFVYNGRLIAPKRFGNKERVPLEDMVEFTRKTMPDLKNACGFKLEKFMKSMDTRPENQ